MRNPRVVDDRADETEPAAAAAPAAPSLRSAAAKPSAPPIPPRDATSVARRRAWTEPHVRFWWLCGIVLVLIGSYIAGRQLLARHRIVRLIQNGEVVTARIVQIKTLTVPDKKFPPDTPATIEFELNGQLHKKQGILEGHQGHIITGREYKIRVDKDDPDNWTYRTEPTPLINALIGAMIPLPLGVVLLIVALFARARYLRLWREGEALPAEVIDSRPTALAPRSRAARVTHALDADRRIYIVYLPHRGAPAPGERVWLLVRPDQKGPVAAAAWFE